MNKIIAKFARDQLKLKLATCTDKQQHTFKQMYSHTDLDKSIDEVVDCMQDTKLDWALSQVENTLEKSA